MTETLPPAEDRGPLRGPPAWAIQVAGRRASADALNWLSAGFLGWARAPDVPLERYLRLPTTAFQKRLMLRNMWLALAVRVIDGGELLWPRCCAVSKALDDFLAGTWPRWHAYAEPPLGTSELRCALFYIARLRTGRGLEKGLTPKTIYDSVKEVF